MEDVSVCKRFSSSHLDDRVRKRYLYDLSFKLLNPEKVSNSLLELSNYSCYSKIRSKYCKQTRIQRSRYTFVVDTININIYNTYQVSHEYTHLSV